MSDLFHESLTNEQIAAVFGVMAACPQHVFQVLTKRAKRMLEWFEWYEGDSGTGAHPYAAVMQAVATVDAAPSSSKDWFEIGKHAPWPLQNVHLGVSCENQAAADERIPLLLQCPAAVRWVSYEPALGGIDISDALSGYCGGCRIHGDFNHSGRCERTRLDWVVCGGESGPRARPMHPDWVRSIRDQCKSAGVPFHFKQWGEWLPGGFYDGFIVPDCMGSAMNNPKNMHYFEPPLGKVWRVGKRQAGHLLDGHEYRMWPGDEWQ
jgi:protein gp37